MYTVRAIIQLTRVDSSVMGFLCLFIPVYARTGDVGLSLGRAIPLLFICMCTFIANDLDDFERDRINHPERPLPGHRLSPTHNLAIDSWRGKRGESLHDAGDAGDSGEPPSERLRTGDPDALERLLDFERGAMLAACMHELPAIHREVLTLRFEEDMKLEEIAEVAGVPLSTVKSRLRRALEGLRAAMDARSPRRKGA